MKIGRGIGILIFLFTLFLLFMSGEAQDKKKSGKGDEKKPKAEVGFGFTASRDPIDINSDSVEMNQKENTFTFVGNVVAKQKDTTLYTNKLIIFNDSNTKKLKEVVAVGNVKVVQLERRATSQKATFYQGENKVVFDGEVVIWEGENIIRGDRVTYYADEERSVVEPKKGGQVNTHITPTQKEEKEIKK
jgi:lipopolysaccharide export system protein LptA